MGADNGLGVVEEIGDSSEGSAEKGNQVTAGAENDASRVPENQGTNDEIGQVTSSTTGKLSEQIPLFQTLKGETPREQLVVQTRDDETLSNLRKLATERLRGYSWEDNLLFKHQLDDLGRNT